MTPELAVELAALGLAAYATWLSLPRPPDLDWQRLWKVGLSVLIAGQVERAHGAADDAARAEWERRALGPLAWNPVGRLAEDKLRHPDLESVPVPALEGERALVEDLAALDSPAARHERMYVRDERSRGELLGDPADLGEDHDPAHVLGPGASWDDVAAWSSSLQDVLRRRLGGVVIATAGLDPVLVEALGRTFEGVRVLTLPRPSADEDRVVALAELFDTIEAALHTDSDRIVLVASGAAVHSLLEGLVLGPGLRDITLAVVGLGADVRRPDRAAWLGEHFTHDALDTELRRSIPFMSVVDVDPADPVAHSWDRQRFPQPPPTPQGHAPIAAVDLGPLHLAGVEPDVLARGLVLLLALRITSHG